MSLKTLAGGRALDINAANNMELYKALMFLTSEKIEQMAHAEAQKK